MSFLDGLYQDRKRLADVLADEEYSGIREIVEELYPDKAHFLYELLQNAEDTRASKVTFTLDQTKLTFEHDGLPFSEDDVRAITNIGRGSKRNSNDKIGRFGVGFKAVFAYTESPFVWSPSFSFRIDSLVLPKAIAGLSSPNTRFEFPFNNPKKPARTAHREILAGLRGLQESSLLFLRHLECVEWRTEAGLGGRIERVRHSDHHFEMWKEAGDGSASHRHYLKFEQPVRELPGRHVGIAFDLDYLPNVSEYDLRVPLHEQMRIVDSNPGQVFVFFPAEKEVSGLQFHLQAPFVPELSRASIKDTPANDTLFVQLAELTAASLHEVHEMGLLSLEFLGILPNANDSLPAKYEQIRSAVIEEMNAQALTPTHLKGHAPARLLLQAPGTFKGLVGDAELGTFWSSELGQVQWAAGAVRNSRPERFLSSLEIDDWDVADFVGNLAEVLGSPAKHSPVEPVEAWLKTRTPEWFRKFYALLNREYLNGPSAPSWERGRRLKNLQGLRLVRTTRGDMVKSDEAYFGVSGVDRSLEFPQVEPLTYTGKARDAADQQAAYELLQKIGVKELGQVEQMKVYLQANYGSRLHPQIDDIERLMQFLDAHPEQAALLKDYRILASGDGRSLEWARPQDMILAAPLLQTGLEFFFAEEIREQTRYVVSSRYLQLKGKLPKFLQFCRAVGVQTELVIRKVPLQKNPHYARMVAAAQGGWTDLGVSEDYYIFDLERLLKRPTVAAAQLIWNTMSANKDRSVLEARYRKNSRYDLQTAPSRLVGQLAEAHWVPQGNGKFVRPSQAVPDRLPEGFPYDSGAAWLKAIGFGRQASQEQAKQQEQQKMAQQLGFSNADDLQFARKIAQLSKKDREWVERELAARERKRTPFPEHEPSNPTRRGERVEEEAKSAPGKETDIRPRSVPVNRADVRSRTRQYLIQQYTVDGELFCQVCQEPMPFKLQDGEPYLEATQLLPDDADIQYQNYLSLCPNHAAMFKHANASRDILHELVTECKSLAFPLSLAGRELEVRFTRTHILDLKSILQQKSKEKKAVST